MEVEEATKSELPAETTHGFKIVDEEGVTQLFFHWHEQPVEEQLLHQYGEDDEVPAEVDPLQTRTLQTRTSYADVLKALPDRLEAHGYGSGAAEIMGKVVRLFGA